MSNSSHAVIIGLDGYQNNVKKLQGAVNDAVAFNAWLIDPGPRGGRVPDGNVVRFIEGVSDTVNYDAILKGMNRKIGLEPLNNSEAGVRDRLYIYLAGHGITVTHSLMDEGQLTVLLSLEFDPVDPGNQISVQAIKVGLDRLRYYKEVVLIMDCCRDLNYSAELTHFWASKLRRTGANISPPAVFAMYAVKSAQRTREFVAEDGKHRGYFTHALIRNLYNAVDSSGKITFDSVSIAMHNALDTAPEFIPPNASSKLVFSDSGDVSPARILIDISSFRGKDGDLRLVDPGHQVATIPLLNTEPQISIDPAEPGAYTALLELRDGTLVPENLKLISFKVGAGQQYQLSYTGGGSP